MYTMRQSKNIHIVHCGLVDDLYTLRMANKLKLLRTQAGLTQAQLADAVGTTKDNISKMERGTRASLSKWAVKLAPPLKCRPSDLLDDIPLAEKIRDALERHGLKEKLINLKNSPSGLDISKILSPDWEATPADAAQISLVLDIPLWEMLGTPVMVPVIATVKEGVVTFIREKWRDADEVVIENDDTVEEVAAPFTEFQGMQPKAYRLVDDSHRPALKSGAVLFVIHRYHGDFRWLVEKEDGLNAICRVKGGNVLLRHVMAGQQPDRYDLMDLRGGNLERGVELEWLEPIEVSRQR